MPYFQFEPSVGHFSYPNPKQEGNPAVINQRFHFLIVEPVLNGVMRFKFQLASFAMLSLGHIMYCTAYNQWVEHYCNNMI